MDNGKYINAYIETISATLHEYLNNMLQLKAQQKVMEEMIVDKDAQISALTQQNTINNDMLSELNELRSQNATLVNKASQVDTFAKQVIEMKQMIIERDKQLEKFTKKTAPKKIVTPKPTDDF